MSNFQFLESHWTDLAKLGDLSEKYVYSDPNTSIIKQGILSEVMVKYMLAYDGIAEPAYDNTHANRIRILKKQVKVSFATTKYNIDDLENTYKLCESLGVSSFRTQKLSISGRVKGHEESIYATEKQIRRFETFIYNQRGKGIPIEFRSPAEHVQFGVKNGYAIVARINSEGLVGISPYIDAYFGDLKKESLKEIWDRMKMGWHNPEMLELAKKMDERGNGTLIDTLEERLMIGEV